MKSVKFGIVGCGAIARRRHIPDLAQNPAGKLVAFCDVVRSRAEELAGQYVGKRYDDFNKMLADADIDAVIVATPNRFHAPQAIAAFEAGKHVLVEKPMAGSRDEAHAMMEAAKKAGKFLMVGQNQRLEPHHQKAREIIASSRLGKVLSFRTAFKHRGPDYWSIDQGPGTWFFKKDPAVMGVCGDLGIHKADLMRFILGDEIVAVSAMMGTQNKTYEDGKPIDVEDNAMMLVRTAGGIMGSIIISWTNYGETEANYTVFYCEKGVMMLSLDPQYNIIVRYRNGQEERYKTGQVSTNEKQVSSGVSDAFVRSILTNTPPEIDGMEGYRSLDVILTAIEADQQGKTLKVASAAK